MPEKPTKNRREEESAKKPLNEKSWRDELKVEPPLSALREARLTLKDGRKFFSRLNMPALQWVQWTTGLLTSQGLCPDFVSALVTTIHGQIGWSRWRVGKYCLDPLDRSVNGTSPSKLTPLVHLLETICCSPDSSLLSPGECVASITLPMPSQLLQEIDVLGEIMIARIQRGQVHDGSLIRQSRDGLLQVHSQVGETPAMHNNRDKNVRFAEVSSLNSKNSNMTSHSEDIRQEFTPGTRT